MKKLTALGAICLLGACQASEVPVLGKVAKTAATSNAPMRPSGTAFESIKVTDFDTCVGIGIIVPGTAPIQCVHEGVTYTGT